MAISLGYDKIIIQIIYPNKRDVKYNTVYKKCYIILYKGVVYEKYKYSFSSR